MRNFICKLDELADRASFEFTVGYGDWPLRGFVVRYRGELRAYVNRCPHAGLPLNFKPHEFFAPDVALLQCTVHGALFEPLTGECVAGPCVGLGLRELQICVIDNAVYLLNAQDVLASCWA